MLVIVFATTERPFNATLPALAENVCALIASL